MLIKSNEERSRYNLVEHRTCVLCEKVLTYPRVIIRNKYHASYHLRCALVVALEVMVDVNALFGSSDLEDISHKLVVANMMGASGPNTEELSAMSQTLEGAVKKR